MTSSAECPKSQRTEYVELQSFPVVPKRRILTDDEVFYKRYRPFISETKDGIITSMAFNPVKPAELVLTYGTKAEVYNLKSGQCSMRVSSFKDYSKSASYRQDGKLMVLTDASGLLQVADMGSKKILRKLRGHEECANVARFGSTASVMSAGNDKMLMLWDVAQGQKVCSTEAHTDYVRALQVSPISEHTWISGGYDKIVKVWDSRIGGEEGMKCVMQFAQGKAVEDLVMMPTGLVCMAAGGTEVKSWDLATGKVVSTFNQHTKAITGLALNHNATAVLTSSLDCTLKVTDLVDCKVQMSYKMSAPSLCAAWSSDSAMLAGGLQSGQFLVRRNKKLVSNPKQAAVTSKRLQPGTAQFFRRGLKAAPSAGDNIVEHDKQKENLADFYFRSFEYQKLMDLVFQQRVSREGQKKLAVGTSVTPFKLAIIDRLTQQGGLEAAVCPRSDDDCAKLVTWLAGALKENVAFLPLVAETIAHVLKNECMQRPSDELRAALNKMHFAVMNEIVMQSNLLPILGLLDLIMQ